MRYVPFSGCCAAAIQCEFWSPSGGLYSIDDIDNFLKENINVERINSTRMSLAILHQFQYDEYAPVFEKYGYKVVDKTIGNGGALIYLLLKKTRNAKPKV